MADFKWKIRLSTLKLRRIDEVEEDDFKTWALTTVATSGGVAAGLWYSSSDGQASAAGDPNANLGKTSVRLRIDVMLVIDPFPMCRSRMGWRQRTTSLEDHRKSSFQKPLLAPLLIPRLL